MSRISATAKIDNFEVIIEKVRSMFPDIKFVNSSESSWSYKHKSICYNKKSSTALYDLLHEIGHMKAGHSKYSSDSELLKYEAEAWEIAQNLAIELGQDMDKKYINKCMDSYRSWIYQRSLCPTCHQVGIETSEKVYKCFNCSNQWQVGHSQKKRIYKKTSR